MRVFTAEVIVDRVVREVLLIDIVARNGKEAKQKATLSAKIFPDPIDISGVHSCLRVEENTLDAKVNDVSLQQKEEYYDGEAS